MKIKNKTDLVRYLYDMHSRVRALRETTNNNAEVDHLTDFLLGISRLIYEANKS